MRNTLLIIEDNEINREVLTDILEEENYEILTAKDGEEGLQMIKKNLDSIAAILLDLVMPKLDGYGVIRELTYMNLIGKIPILIISGESLVSEERCFDYGVSDFIRKPFNYKLVKQRVANTVELFNYKASLEERVVKQTETLQKQYHVLKLQSDKLKKSKENIIDILGTVVESRDLESGEHIMRVKDYTRILAAEMMRQYPEYKLTAEQIDAIAAASALHDIGKIGIPDKILLKPGRLDKDEFEVMKTHTTIGSKMISNIRNVWDENYGKISYEICRHHHEKWDGKGYPDGLKGDQIPLSAQIVSIADVYDALVNKRVYKDAYAAEEAFKMIINGECGAFSPKLLKAFKSVRLKFEALLRQEISSK
ncbi:MAG: HD domain-containing protein [Lachnospiraceae bacterium]|nr:HD domain-containing protein [Lachnospiraceae bacterium]